MIDAESMTIAECCALAYNAKYVHDSSTTAATLTRAACALPA